MPRYGFGALFRREPRIRHSSFAAIESQRVYRKRSAQTDNPHRRRPCACAEMYEAARHRAKFFAENRRERKNRDDRLRGLGTSHQFGNARMHEKFYRGTVGTNGEWRSRLLCPVLTLERFAERYVMKACSEKRTRNRRRTSALFYHQLYIGDNCINFTF